MQKAHDASYNNHWKDKPDLSSPILAAQLNRIEQSTDTIDDRVVLFDTTKANQTDLLQSLKTLTYDTSTGVFVFTYWNGSTLTVDLNIEKIPVSFSLSPQGILTMVTADGTTYTCDIAALIKLYTFTDSTDIDFTTTTDSSGNKTITAHIVNGSVTEEKLEPNFLGNCRIEVSKAETAADNSEAWATGKIDGTDVPSTATQYHNNSKYYSEQADDRAEDSEAWAVGKRDGTDVPSTDPTYHNNSKYYADMAESIVGHKVTSFNGRENVVTSQAGDYSMDMIAPTTGATDGQIPIVRNVGTEQEPEYEFSMEDVPSSGHVIRNVNGDLAQQPTLYFEDAYVTNDGTNSRTEINVMQPVHRLSYFEDAVDLPDGIYPIDGDELAVIQADMVEYGNGTVDDALADLPKKIQCGSASVNVAANSIGTVAVTFDTPFTTAPYVTATIVGDGLLTPYNEVTGPNIGGITTTGFSLRVVNKYSTALLVYLNWIAVEPRQ